VRADEMRKSTDRAVKYKIISTLSLFQKIIGTIKMNDVLTLLQSQVVESGITLMMKKFADLKQTGKKRCFIIWGIKTFYGSPQTNIYTDKFAFGLSFFSLVQLINSRH
jgi:hypothetical protein